MPNQIESKIQFSKFLNAPNKYLQFGAKLEIYSPANEAFLELYISLKMPLPESVGLEDWLPRYWHNQPTRNIISRSKVKLENSTYSLVQRADFFGRELHATSETNKMKLIY